MRYIFAEISDNTRTQHDQLRSSSLVIIFSRQIYHVRGKLYHSYWLYVEKEVNMDVADRTIGGAVVRDQLAEGCQKLFQEFLEE